jgi:transaldolase
VAQHFQTWREWDVTSSEIPIEVFADGANISEMVRLYRSGVAKGFTTNPFFLNQAGVKDYEQFAREVIRAIPDRSLSFEVLSDDVAAMEGEARKVASWSPNIYVKIPIQNTRGQSTTPLIRKLSREGMKLNVTVIFSYEQGKAAAEALSPDVDTIISIFSGRIGATGVDPKPIVKRVAALVKSIPLPRCRLLWAATREVFNLVEAIECGCGIITMGADLIDGLGTLGVPLEEGSRRMVQMFFDAAQKAGLKL